MECSHVLLGNRWGGNIDLFTGHAHAMYNSYVKDHATAIDRIQGPDLSECVLLNTALTAGGRAGGIAVFTGKIL